MSSACEAARKHMVRRPAKPPSLAALYTLSSQATHEAVHLLSQMLVFNPVNDSFQWPRDRPESLRHWTLTVDSGFFFFSNFFYFWILLQEKRINVVDALAHPYLDEGRLRFHSCMCRCCQTANPPGSVAVRRYAPDLEPSAMHPFEDHWERELTSTHQVRGNFNCCNSIQIIRLVYWIYWERFDHSSSHGVDSTSNILQRC